MRNENGTIRVLFAKYPPMAYDCHGKFPVLRPSTKCPDPGWAIEIFLFLAGSLHLKIVPVIADFPDDWGTHANGTHNDPLTYVENGIVDVVALFFQDTDDRRRRVSLTHPIYYVRPIFLVRKYVDNFENAFNLVRFLDVYVWVLMLIVCAAQYGLLLLAQSLPASSVRGTCHELMFHVFALQFRQPLKSPWTKSSAINCSLLFFCLLQTGILMSLYEGRTLGHLLQPVAKAPFVTYASGCVSPQRKRPAIDPASRMIHVTMFVRVLHAN
ncbi:Protein W02A2.5 [Aphelenchoides avenae]|nr:Protein W02A2.5 [Aphelenchus avenae]